MKAKLAQKEPEILRKWEEMNLYHKILENRKQSEIFVLHDGPPYANGNIHLGTALNKILKDFIIKTKTMQGFKASFVPGWDCHGLPIEIKVDQVLKKEKRELPVIEIRKECHDYAMKYVDIQREQFKRLGVLARWDHPYLTVHPAYEAEVLRCLAAFFDQQKMEHVLQHQDVPGFAYLKDPLKLWYDCISIRYGVAGFHVWDIVAAVYITHPELFDRNQVCIASTPEDLQSGFLRVDRNGTVNRVNLPTKIQDLDRFWQIVFAAWGNAI